MRQKGKNQQLKEEAGRRVTIRQQQQQQRRHLAHINSLHN